MIFSTSLMILDALGGGCFLLRHHRFPFSINAITTRRGTNIVTRVLGDQPSSNVILQVSMITATGFTAVGLQEMVEYL